MIYQQPYDPFGVEAALADHIPIEEPPTKLYVLPFGTPETWRVRWLGAVSVRVPAAVMVPLAITNPLGEGELQLP